jgi:hypothetical protein
MFEQICMFTRYVCLPDMYVEPCSFQILAAILHVYIVKQETFAVLTADKQATMSPLHARLPGDPRESTSTWAFLRLPHPLRRQKVLVSHARSPILNYLVAAAHFFGSWPAIFLSLFVPPGSLARLLGFLGSDLEGFGETSLA